MLNSYSLLWFCLKNQLSVQGNIRTPSQNKSSSATMTNIKAAQKRPQANFNLLELTNLIYTIIQKSKTVKLRNA